MNSHDIFDKIPDDVKKFRFENGLVWFKKHADENVDFYIKNIDEDFHMHFFTQDKKTSVVITRENRRGKDDEHKSIDPDELLSSLKNVVIEGWKILERVDPTDPNFIGKKVVLFTIPEISLDTISGKKACFKQNYTMEESDFQSIDLHKIRLGSIRDENDHETDALIIRNGEMYRFNMDELKKLEKKFDHDHNLRILSNS